MSLFPDWLVPMAATLTQERFTGPEWIFERKFDGVRLLAFRDGSNVRLLSRNRLAQNVPAIADAIAKLPVKTSFSMARSRGVQYRSGSRITSSTSCGSMAVT